VRCRSADIAPDLPIYGDFRLKPPFRLCNVGPAKRPITESAGTPEKFAPDV